MQNRVPQIFTKAFRIIRSEGLRELTMRVTRYAANKLNVSSLDENVYDDDIAGSSELSLLLPAERPRRDRPLVVGWVIVPPAAGSGGHTTLFRMVEGIEAAGHQCRLFVHDRFGGDLPSQTQVIRDWWPDIKAQVCSTTDEIDGVDACVASSWETAHVLASRGGAPMRRLYFIQDYEPYFYPRGAMYALAEDTYRFGFRNVALGAMVASALEREVGVDADVTEFGCDTTMYRPTTAGPRRGVVLYARPQVPRRGFWLACAALEKFHRRHPDVPIHLYGSTVPDLPFPATQHGRQTPQQLNELYNTCIAGIALSFTNISLVAEEMLAAGTIPVVNDSTDARADIQNPHVAWAPPTPSGLAAALDAAVSREDIDAHAETAAASVESVGWTQAQHDIVRIVEDEVYGP